MKIVILADNIYESGGAGVIALNHAKYLKGSGFEVSIITTSRDKSFVGKKDDSGMDVYILYSDYKPLWRAYLSISNPFILSEIEKILINIKPDIVHTHNIHYHISYKSLSKAKKYAKGVFVTTHDSMPFNYSKLFPSSIKMDGSSVVNYKISKWKQLKYVKWEYNPFRNLFIKKYLRLADRIFSVSDALRKALNDNGIYNVETIHNGIDIEKWKADEKDIVDFKERFNLHNKKVLFFGGRLSDAKGGKVILKSMKSIVSHYPETCLLVVGKEDNYAIKMLKRAKESGLDKNILFTGWIDNNLIKYAYYNSIVTLIPSLCFDWFPTNILESFACSRPVIAGCFGGAKEIVDDGKNGFIIDPRNDENLTEKILFIMDDKEKSEKMGKNGLNTVSSDFSYDECFGRMVEYYRNIIK